MRGRSNYPTSFEAPTSFADNYGTCMRGYLVAPTTDSYTFWIASDDNSELWLSTDGSHGPQPTATVPGPMPNATPIGVLPTATATASPTSPPNTTIRRIEWVTLSLGGQLVGAHVTAYDAASGGNEVTTSDTGLFYFHTDHLGSVAAISDANGAVQGDIIRFGRLANCTAARRFIDLLIERQ